MTYNFENPVESLKARALESGVSINELCKAAKVARSTFVRWENESTSPTFSKIQELETALKRLNRKSRHRMLPQTPASP